MSLLLSGTDGLSDVDGTAATPAIRGTDTNTGIFFPAADTIAFSEGGTEIARFDNAGNLGIGTNSPTERLSVSGAISCTSNASSFNQPKAVVDYASGAGRFSSFVSTGSTLQFFTNPNGGTVLERMRINAAGDWLLGTTTSGGKATILWSSDSQAGIVTRSSSETYAGSPVVFQNSSGGTAGFISQSTSAVAYNTSSDYRLKENVAPMTGALAKVAQLKPVTYTWKVDGSAGQGFIAHELQAVVPDCVTGAKDAVETVDDLDADGRKIGTKEVPRYQGVDTSFLVATLVCAIQELKSEFDAYKATHP